MRFIRGALVLTSVTTAVALGTNGCGSDHEKEPVPSGELDLTLPKAGAPLVLPPGVIGISVRTKDGAVELYSAPANNPSAIKIANIGSFGNEEQRDKIDEIIENSVKRAAKASDPDGKLVPQDSIVVEDSDVLFADGFPVEVCDVSAGAGESYGYGRPMPADCRRIAEIVFNNLEVDPSKIPALPLDNDGVA